MKCEYCDGDISENAQACPHCGGTVTNRPVPVPDTFSSKTQQPYGKVKKGQVSAIMAGWFASNQDKFDIATRMLIQKKMDEISDDKAMMLSALELKDSTTLIVVDIFFGYLGVHQFMLGNIGMGIFELLTAGGCGILWIIDLFTITKQVQKKNALMIAPYL